VFISFFLLFNSIFDGIFLLALEVFLILCDYWDVGRGFFSGITNMLLYSAERGHLIAAYTTLQGMSILDFERIKDVQYDYFVIHIPDVEGNSRIIVNDKYLELLGKIVTTPLKIASERQYSCHGTVPPEISKIIGDSGRIANTMIDRAGNLDDASLLHHVNHGEIACIHNARNIDHNVLLPDGTVLLCCMDYSMEHILGNLLHDTYENLFESAAAQKITRAFQDETIPLLCRKCHQAVKFDSD
jgi:hypothetical protein